MLEEGGLTAKVALTVDKDDPVRAWESLGQEIGGAGACGMR